MQNIKKNSWIDYWNTDNMWTDSPLWIKNAELFFSSVQPLLNINPDDAVLDIGCGSGCLIDQLYGHVKTIVGVDTAENYVNLCRKKFGHLRNIEIHQLSEDYTKLSFRGQKFTIIFALSVVQYYKEWKEIVDLVKEVGNIAASGARFLIADIPCENNRKKGTIAHIGRMLIAALKEKYLADVIRSLYAMYICDSFYRKTMKEYPTIDIPIKEIQEIVSGELGYAAEIIDRQLTVNVNRKHLLIYY